MCGIIGFLDKRGRQEHSLGRTMLTIPACPQPVSTTSSSSRAARRRGRATRIVATGRPVGCPGGRSHRGGNGADQQSHAKGTADHAFSLVMDADPFPTRTQTAGPGSTLGNLVRITNMPNAGALAK